MDILEIPPPPKKKNKGISGAERWGRAGVCDEEVKVLPEKIYDK
jgi:hypothetical protein